MRITASDVSRATSGRLVGVDVVADGCAFDSRQLRTGQAFVAIEGDRDGHDFIDDAISRGARFAIVRQGRSRPDITCIEVDDTVRALAAVGTWCREQLDVRVQHRVVGITGSAGKTSTKNAVQAVLRGGFAHVHASDRSLNNDIGVPITLMNAPENTDAVVMEMGMRGLGEIERLCAIAQPVIGIVTNVGDAHGERVGGIEGVARAKSELIESLPEHGVAILNADDERVRDMKAHTWAHVMTYGTQLGADVRWVANDVLPTGQIATTFSFDGEHLQATPTSPGVHMAANAAAAIAAGIAAGMSFELSVSQIGRETTEPGRMQWRNGPSGSRILDDTYNANSTSMSAALQVVASMQASRRIAILGPMYEVEHPEKAHQDIAAIARNYSIDVMAVETDLYGVAPLSIDEIAEALQLDEGDVVLVKGSRAAAMERVVTALLSA